MQSMEALEVESRSDGWFETASTGLVRVFTAPLAARGQRAPDRHGSLFLGEKARMARLGLDRPELPRITLKP